MTPDEARSALQELNRCFSIEEAKDLAKIAPGNGDDFIGLDSRFHNVFFHEMRPCIVIAAHARSESLTLVTNNEREFSRVEGLRVENWAAV